MDEQSGRLDSAMSYLLSLKQAGTPLDDEKTLDLKSQIPFVPADCFQVLYNWITP